MLVYGGIIAGFISGEDPVIIKMISRCPSAKQPSTVAPSFKPSVIPTATPSVKQSTSPLKSLLLTQQLLLLQSR
jgi:hypothetical protein